MQILQNYLVVQLIQRVFNDEALINDKPEKPRNVLVVGGGIAGLEAAIVAHDRGHKVTIIEKTDKLGDFYSLQIQIHTKLT